VKIFANENLFEPIIDYLRSFGHDVLSIRDAGLSGISDDEVYQKACEENSVIITMDKDFSRMFRFPPEKCGGIIVVKIYKNREKGDRYIIRELGDNRRVAVKIIDDRGIESLKIIEVE
jgi:hypothetical protein